jgi:hypothetical protein
MEQTPVQLRETMDAGQQPGPEHPGEQAQETVQGTVKQRVGQAREMVRKAAAGKVEPLASSARDTAQRVAGGARDTAQKVAGGAGDMARKVVSTTRDRASGGVSGMAATSQTVEQTGQKQPAGTGLLAGGLTGWSVGMAIGLVAGLIAGLFLGLLINNTARSYAMARAELPRTMAPRPWWMLRRRT